MTSAHDPIPPSADRLEDLEAQIDEIRDRVDDPLDQGDATFIEGGENDGPQDDTIVPPG